MQEFKAKKIVRGKFLDRSYELDLSIIKKPYLLKPGDRLFMINYEGRGWLLSDVLIIDVTNQYLVVTDSWLYEDKVFALEFDHEPDYLEVFGDKERWSMFKSREPEPRTLEITPFPVFVEEFDMKKITEVTPDDKWFHRSRNSLVFWSVNDYKDYVNNFANIGKQGSLFQGG